MKALLQLQFTLLLIIGLIPLGCSTRHTQSPEKPMGEGHLAKADPSLEPFLISHGFHLDESQNYIRQYRTLSEAGQNLGISLVNLPIPPNGPAPGFGERDERVFWLHHWGFSVLAEKSRTLNDPDTPCTVSTSLIQFQ